MTWDGSLEPPLRRGVCHVRRDGRFLLTAGPLLVFLLAPGNRCVSVAAAAVVVGLVYQLFAVDCGFLCPGLVGMVT